MELTSINAAPASRRASAAVGGLPPDWTEQAIGEFCAVKTGPFGTLLKASEYSEIDGVPVISVGEVREGYFRLNEHTPLVPEIVQRRLPQYLLQAGDVVFGRKGAVDRSALVRQPQAGWFLGSDGIAVRPSAEHCPEYVAAQFQSIRVRQWLASNSTGTTMASMNQGVLSRVVIPFPPTAEEERSIAKVLNDADALIKSLEQLLTKKRLIKQGAMQELLTGKRRLAGFARHWKQMEVRELGVFLKGSGVKREEALSGDLPCIRYGEIYTTHSDYVRTYSSWISSAVASAATLLCRGDLLFAGSGETKKEIGKCVAFLDDGPAYAGGDIVILRPTVRADSMFLGYLLNTPGVVRQKASKGQGDAVVHISANALGKVEVVLPEPSEQAAIAKVLFDMDSELDTLESRLAKGRALKHAMAQALLTGRIRLMESTA